MSRKEIKAAAKTQLGGRIFKNNWIFAILMAIFGGILISVSSATLIGLFFLALPINYGLVKLFLKQSRDNEKMQVSTLFAGFTDDYGGVIGVQIMTVIFEFLWSLLFCIPGIIKHYSYSMAIYVKADHPDYDWHKCMAESKTMMKGNKWKFFVLQLSFIGWDIVGCLCLGIGSLWVGAYKSASYAQFYNSLTK